MNTASIVLQLVSVGLLVYVLVKILEVERSVEELKEEPETTRVDEDKNSDMFKPIPKSPPKFIEEIVELENDEDVDEDGEE